MVSKERYRDSWSKGKITEELFVLSCKSIGYTTVKTPSNVDIYKHIDFYITRPDGTKTSVDVKGGNNPNLIWIEFKNVHGNLGWMYGEAEFIAFEMKELGGFCMVDRKELLDVCKNIIEPVFTDKYNCYLKLYQRANRKDVLSKIYLSDIQNCKSYNLIKYDDTGEN
jgi:hypothetical protein